VLHAQRMYVCACVYTQSSVDPSRLLLCHTCHSTDLEHFNALIAGQLNHARAGSNNAPSGSDSDSCNATNTTDSQDDVSDSCGLAIASSAAAAVDGTTLQSALQLTADKAVQRSVAQVFTALDQHMTATYTLAAWLPTTQPAAAAAEPAAGLQPAVPPIFPGARVDAVDDSPLLALFGGAVHLPATSSARASSGVGVGEGSSDDDDVDELMALLAM
jgi:cytoskeletal protein RodZ